MLLDAGSISDDFDVKSLSLAVSLPSFLPGLYVWVCESHSVENITQVK